MIVSGATTLDSAASAGTNDACCATCGHPQHAFDRLPRAYAYLLGVYLGDGHITTHRRDVHRLRLYLDAAYPGIVGEAAAAAGEVVPGSAVNVASNVRGERLTVVSSYSKQWICLFPQHGVGPKHSRRIVLDDWQSELVRRYPADLIRGLIHSDGSRFRNTVVVGGSRYAYWRYTFTNRSADIRDIFCGACDLLDVPWRRMNGQTISIARRAGVEMMDSIAGPKT